MPDAVDVHELVLDGHAGRLVPFGTGKARAMNRFFRRMERFGKSFSGRRSQGQMPVKQMDVPDPRAKNTGHGKKTADKWNQ